MSNPIVFVHFTHIETETSLTFCGLFYDLLNVY